MPYREITPQKLPDNLFARIGEDWMLLCAGTLENCNAMTCSWGQAGILWSRPVATCYVRPQRYTRKFMEEQGYFTLNFMAPGSLKNELTLMGTKSGRDGDKTAEAGLHLHSFNGQPGFEEAALVMVCRQLYKQDMLENCFIDRNTAAANYPEKDYHRMYVGEIEHIFVKE